MLFIYIWPLQVAYHPCRTLLRVQQTEEKAEDAKMDETLDLQLREYIDPNKEKWNGLQSADQKTVMTQVL